MQLKPITDRTGPMPLYGITEWQCWYGHYDLVAEKPETVVDECIDVHLQLGFTDLVWNAGRSTLEYHSELPHATRTWGPHAGDPTGSKRTIRDVLDRMCPLRAGLKRCRAEGLGFLARLGMNRHYGGTPAKPSGNTSVFAMEHPRYHEQQIDGKPVSHKLCYVFDEVQQERIDILLELQRIGPDALVLDFCRQSPILMFHPALVEPYMKKTGTDPRKLNTGRFEDYQDWWQYRADVLTGFMRRLREQMSRQARELGRSCPIVARMPDASRPMLLALGIDLPRWFEDDLIDATMVSPFPLLAEDSNRHFDWHIELAHGYGRACIGGLGSRGLFTHNNMNETNKCPDVQPRHALELVDQQYDAGCDGLSVYQTETLARLEMPAKLLRDAADPQAVKRKLAALPGEPRGNLSQTGLDWHSCVPPRPAHGLTDQVSNWLRI